MGRNICFHYHLFKNAGSSIDFILRRNFGNKFLSYDGPAPNSVLPSEYLKELILDYLHIEAFSSHQGRFPVPTGDEFLVLPILFIRNPIDRAGSVYSFLNRSNGNSIPEKLARNGDFKEYIEWTLSPQGHKTCLNFQVAYCSNRINFSRKSTSNQELREAIDRIHSLPFVGLVEQFDESLVLLTEFLGKTFGNFSPAFVKKNVSMDRSGSVDDKVHEMKDQLGDVLFNKLYEANRLDLELFDEVKRVINQRIKSDEWFLSKLENLKKTSINLADEES